MDLDEQIVKFLGHQDWPVTTETVAKELKISWNTAALHLMKLVTEGKVKGKRVGRQNQWLLVNHRFPEGER